MGYTIRGCWRSWTWKQQQLETLGCRPRKTKKAPRTQGASTPRSEPLAWEPQEVSLPDDLYAVHYLFSQGSLHLDAKTLLEGCPRWLKLKTRAEQNIYRQDGGKKVDQVLRMVQQELLGLQRL